jgi:hypothetical protein
LDLVAKATEKIQVVNMLHDEVIKQYSTLEQRKIGFVLHAEKIEVSVQPHKFTNDWAKTGLLLSCTTIKSIGRVLKEIRSLLVRLFPCHGLVTFSIHRLLVYGFNQ